MQRAERRAGLYATLVRHQYVEFRSSRRNEADSKVAQKIQRDLGNVPSSSISDDAETLKESLELEATTMLIDFLRKTRTSRRKGGGSRGLDSRKLDMVSPLPHDSS